MRAARERPLIAFFEYADVFEDFYPHYGVNQLDFATRWADTGNHAWASLLQREIGDVLWYEFSLDPQVGEIRHQVTGCRVKFLLSSWLHRRLWKIFYGPRYSWSWRFAYPAYAAIASYAALFSLYFFRALRQDRPDYFFIQDYASGRFDILLMVARLLKIPMVAYHSGSRPEKYVGGFLKRWSIRRAHRLIASNRAEIEMLARRYQVPERNLSLILTPIDTDAFKPVDRTAACRAAGLDPARRYLIYVGRLDDRIKRVSALIRSFAKAVVDQPDYRLLIVGAGADRAKLEELAKEAAPDQTAFLGWIKGAAALAPLYNAADCLVLPSLSEGFPTVIGEAMACGTPVLASSVGGVSELVEEGRTGWLVAPGDEQELGAALHHVMTSPEVVSAMRPQARSMAEKRVSPVVVAAALKNCLVKNESHGSKVR